MSSVQAYMLLLGLLALERVLELHISRRNAERTLAQGGIEVGQAHFRWLTILHTAFFVGCAAEVLVARPAFSVTLGLPMLGLLLAAQALRYWAVSALGSRWNVRVIVTPGVPAVVRGPYRWLRHPNYLAVVAEGVAVPLIHGAWVTATLFTALNVLMLAVRIRCEERALGEHCDYQQRLGDRSRFWPRRLWIDR